MRRLYRALEHVAAAGIVAAQGLNDLTAALGRRLRTAEAWARDGRIEHGPRCPACNAPQQQLPEMTFLGPAFRDCYRRGETWTCLAKKRAERTCPTCGGAQTLEDRPGVTWSLTCYARPDGTAVCNADRRGLVGQAIQGGRR